MTDRQTVVLYFEITRANRQAADLVENDLGIRFGVTAEATASIGLSLLVPKRWLRPLQPA